MMLPDSIRGRISHTTTILHTDDTHKQLVGYGGLDEYPEDDDLDEAVPVVDTTIVEIGEDMCVHVSIIVHHHLVSVCVGV